MLSVHDLLHNITPYRRAALIVVGAIIVIVLILLSVPKRVTTDNVYIDRADSLKYDSPEAALSLLRRIPSVDILNGEERELYNLVKSTAAVLSGDSIENDSLVNAVLAHYSEGGDKVRTVEALYAVGMTYHRFDDDKRAIGYFQKAGTLLQNISPVPEAAYFLYRDWGNIMKAERPYKDPMSLYKQAEKYAFSVKDTSKIIEIQNLMGYELMFMGKFADAGKVFGRTISLAEKTHRSELAAESWKNMAIACKWTKRLPEALTSINRAISAGYPDMKKLYSVKGSILVDMGQLDSARHYVELSRKDDHYYDISTYYFWMSQISKKEGRYAEALAQFEQYALYQDSTFEQMRTRRLAEMQRLYDYSELRAERNAFQLESSRRGTLLILSVVGVAAVTAFAVFLNRRQKQKMKDAISSKDNMLKQSIQQIKDKNYELMQMERRFREREEEMASTLTGKDNELDNLRQRQRDLKMKIFQLDEVVSKIERTRKMNEKKKILSAKQIVLSDDERSSLLNSANLCFDSFVTRLHSQYPSLSDDDLCLCCLMKMRISNQDICILLDLSDYTLRKRKYRMKTAKMELAVGGASIEDFIATY